MGGGEPEGMDIKAGALSRRRRAHLKEVLSKGEVWRLEEDIRRELISNGDIWCWGRTPYHSRYTSTPTHSCVGGSRITRKYYPRGVQRMGEDTRSEWISDRGVRHQEEEIPLFLLHIHAKALLHGVGEGEGGLS